MDLAPDEWSAGSESVEAEPRTTPLQRDLIVVGASAGGVEALATLVRDLPAELPASILVVLHVLASRTSGLPTILARAGKLPATAGVDGQPLERGRIYVAPPDHHMLVHDRHITLTRGPRENGHRPAVDPLFRSAARTYGPRTIGVVLSGALDDGAAGLRFVKEHGGLAVVQDPHEATYSSMPESAVATTDVDRVVPVTRMARALCDLIDEALPPSLVREPPPHGGVDIVEADPTGKPGVDGPPSALTCPECGGALWEQQDGPLVRFQCQVGHVYSVDSLVDEQGRALETALWAALRSLEEHADLMRRMARRAAGRLTGRRFEQRAERSEEHVRLIRDTIERLGRGLESADEERDGAR
jgi:two-component system, chemotaxis family, protein-glutamate methylesterase/glutaminase